MTSATRGQHRPEYSALSHPRAARLSTVEMLIPARQVANTYPQTRLTTIMLAFFCLAMSGCARHIYVCIDNADSAPITVTVNGRTIVTVEPGHRKTVECTPGPAEFRVSRHGQIVRVESHTLQYRSAVGSSRTYLMNPDRTRYYLVADIEYGRSTARSVLNCAATSEQLEVNRKRQLLYSSVAQNLKLLPMTGWHDISGTQFRFHPLPSRVMSHYRRSKIQTVRQVSSTAYHRLLTFLSRVHPTPADIQRLETAMVDVIAAR